MEVTNRPPQSPAGDAMDPAPIDAEAVQSGSGDVAAGPAERPPEPDPRPEAPAQHGTEVVAGSGGSELEESKPFR